MQYAVALLALVASVSAQTATGSPPGCSKDFPQLFEIQTVNVSSSAAHKRDLIAQRGIVCKDIPLITLKGGVMTDQIQRQAEIVANHQFQFDVVLQSGRLYDAGFSVCQNNSLAIGSNAVFWNCNSGDIINIYDQSLGKQCYEVTIEVLPCDSVDLASTVPVSSAATSVPSAASSASSAPSTAAATTSATSVAPTTAAITSSLPGPAIPSVAPFPKGNSTTAAGTASATAPGRATSSALTAPASGASATTVGSTFGLVAAALIAFAMF